mmetsp:Transcript_3363/g.14133  ORF Transcript_3363/g.14133 Transcript_3363/m.14133 type:complete len:216 (+) Transcript_3363:1216-1863(+)
MRNDPPPTSTPLYTKSYATARAFLMSPPFSTSSWFGAVNGWCKASSLFSSSLRSNMGNSVIHNTACFEKSEPSRETSDSSGTKPRVLARNCRTRSRALFTVAESPAPKSKSAPGPAPSTLSMSRDATGCNASHKALPPSKVTPSSATLTNAKPPAPPLTASKKTSPFGFKREFEILEPSGTATAFTTPSFDSSAVAKSLNSVLLSRSFRTLISNP